MAKVNNETPKFSETIRALRFTLDSAQRDFAWNSEELKRMDALTQDLLHKLELGDLPYKERAKVATQLARCRQSRRECKDTIQVLQPLIDYLGTEKGRQLNNLLGEVLGKTRNVEKLMETRVYHPRVLKE